MNVPRSRVTRPSGVSIAGASPGLSTPPWAPTPGSPPGRRANCSPRPSPRTARTAPARPPHRRQYESASRPSGDGGSLAGRRAGFEPAGAGDGVFSRVAASAGSAGSSASAAAAAYSSTAATSGGHPVLPLPRHRSQLVQDMPRHVAHRMGLSSLRAMGQARATRPAPAAAPGAAAVPPRRRPAAPCFARGGRGWRTRARARTRGPPARPRARARDEPGRPRRRASPAPIAEAARGDGRGAGLSRRARRGNGATNNSWQSHSR